MSDVEDFWDAILTLVPGDGGLLEIELTGVTDFSDGAGSLRVVTLGRTCGSGRSRLEGPFLLSSIAGG